MQRCPLSHGIGNGGPLVRLPPLSLAQTPAHVRRCVVRRSDRRELDKGIFNRASRALLERKNSCWCRSPRLWLVVFWCGDGVALLDWRAVAGRRGSAPERRSFAACSEDVIEYSLVTCGLSSGGSSHRRVELRFSCACGFHRHSAGTPSIRSRAGRLA